MPRRPPKRFARPPVDPRARRVVTITPSRAGCANYELECGHVAHRKVRCPPSFLICTDCPPVGGVGGNSFPQRDLEAIGDAVGISPASTSSTIARCRATAFEPWKADPRLGSQRLLEALRRRHPELCRRGPL